jgi:putative protein-disulfide isomerase
MPIPTLWYTADPMCSCCRGFAPVIERIRKEYSQLLSVKLVLGGLRPGTGTPLAPDKRAQILQHWENVHATTGQPFKFENALPDGFIYDTEPASRAVICVARIEPNLVFPFFSAVQHAFYVEQADVTQFSVLRKLAEDLKIPALPFTQFFESTTAREQTLEKIAEKETGYRLITPGYRSFEMLKPHLDTWLAL